MACAIAKDSKIILGDEITSALDDENKKIVTKILRKCANQGKIVILVSHEDNIIENKMCIRDSGISSAMIDRLLLTKQRIEAMAKDVEKIADLKDCIGEVVREIKRPNGLDIKQIRIPIGVVATIYESRPNVTVDKMCIRDRYMKAYNADPQSIFGGIVAVNYKIDKKTAEEMHKIFLEIVAAPDFDEDALEILKKKKNLRILKLKNLDVREAKYDIKYLEGKVLVQDINTKMIKEMNYVTEAKPTKEQISDMEFGMRVVKFVKSNAICIVKEMCIRDRV